MAKKKTAEKPTQKSGGARMKALGKRPVQLGLYPDDLATIDEARAYEPRASFILRVALESARAIIKGRNR